MLVPLRISPFLHRESYSLQDPNLQNYHPKPEYLIIGSFGPLGFSSVLGADPSLWSKARSSESMSHNVPALNLGIDLG